MPWTCISHARSTGVASPGPPHTARHLEQRPPSSPHPEGWHTRHVHVASSTLHARTRAPPTRDLTPHHATASRTQTQGTHTHKASRWPRRSLPFVFPRAQLRPLASLANGLSAREVDTGQRAQHERCTCPMKRIRFCSCTSGSRPSGTCSVAPASWSITFALPVLTAAALPWR